jgi:hypothetical protein
MGKTDGESRDRLARIAERVAIDPPDRIMLDVRTDGVLSGFLVPRWGVYHNDVAVEIPQ